MKAGAAKDSTYSKKLFLEFNEVFITNTDGVLVRRIGPNQIIEKLEK